MKKFIKKRKKSRKIIIQYIYSWLLSKNNITNLNEINIIKNNKNKIDNHFIKITTNQFEKRSKTLNFITQYSIEKHTDLSIIDKIILHLAILEIFFFKNSSFKIIINESIDQSKKFSSKNSYMLINKILNNITKGYIYNNKILL